jgi:hypothetical protein
MLEAQLERARKDNLALRRRLEAAAAGAGARANPALLRVVQARPGPCTPPPAFTCVAHARHGMHPRASHPVGDMRALQGLTQQRWQILQGLFRTLQRSCSCRRRCMRAARMREVHRARGPPPAPCPGLCRHNDRATRHGLAVAAL